jgi:hypothetical protein
MILLALLSTLALAEDPAVPAPELSAEARAEAFRLQEHLDKLAQRNAWSGVERDYQALLALGVQLPTHVHHLGADAARMRGDTWSAYQRLLIVLRAADAESRADQEMRAIRESFGRFEVRRVEETGIELKPYAMPFLPDQRQSIAFAREQLLTTGQFDGMLPEGGYQLGRDYVFRVGSGPEALKPVVIQRVAGDGLSKKELKALLEADAAAAAGAGVTP